MLVFTDCRLDPRAAQKLRELGHTPIPCPPHPMLDTAVSSHPDLLLFITDASILTHADYVCALDSALPVQSIPEQLGQKYPHDVLLDAALVGKYLVCLPDATSAAVLAYAKEKGATVLPVRQGYAKCNLCIVS